MTRKKRQRRYAWLIILVAATACAEPAVPKAEFKVVFSEDFEGEGKDFAPEWDLAGSQFKRDSAVFRNGQASLRIDWGAGQDMVTLWSPGPSVDVGKNYRISFWVKANDRIQSDIGAYPLAGGAGLVGGAFVPGIKWRKIVCGGRVSGEYGFVGPGPTHFWWRIRGKQKKVTLWIDDFKVEEGPVFAEQVGWTPVAADRNLIPNGSLEVDPGRHYLQNHASNDRGPDHDWHFSEDAAFGSRSLKLKPPLRYGTCPPKCTAFMARLGPTLELMDPLAFDSADSEFTMSASVKSILAQPSKVTLVLGPPESIDIPFPPGSITLEMTASGQWTRHQKTFKLPRADDGKYFFYVRGDGALLDGLMLARGKSSKFVARQPIEATLTSARPWRIYEPGDPLAFTLRAVRTRASAPKGLEMTLVNYRHEPGRVVKWQLDAEPGQFVEREVTLDQLPQGCYRAELRAAGAPAVLSDMTFSIMPEPRLVPFMQSNWGVDTGGMSFNTHNWDFAPMYRRLGFRWARLWSNLCLEGEGGAYVFHNLTPEEGLSAANLWLNNLKKLGFGIYASVHPLRKYQTAGGNPYPPKTEEEYAAYEVHLREMAARFGDRIDHWEVSNEPFWPAVSPENYGRMVRETVRILRETHPGSKIISLAGAANGEKEWIERSFEAGATDGVDGISLHYGGYTGVAGGNDGDAVARYGQWRQWAMQGQRPLEVWDSEEHVEGPSFYPSRVQSTTGLQEINDQPAYPALFCTDLKAYLCNSAMGVRTMCFNAEYTMMGSGYERGFWERDGGLTPATVASFLAAQMIQTMKGGGFYRMPGGLFGALVHDKEHSALIVWSANYTGTTQLKRYRDPFDVIDATPRPIEQMTDIRDFFRDVAPVKMKVPDQVAVLDTMTVPVEPEGGEITVDIYPKYLVVPRAREGELLTALGAEQTLEPIPR